MKGLLVGTEVLETATGVITVLAVWCILSLRSG